MDRYAIIVAGGRGVRMGGDVPKQFLPLAGRPVLMHTLEAFRAALPDVRLILVLPVAQQAYWHALCQQHAFDVPVQIADGGETRFHSVLHGLRLIPEGEEALVAVHDGVRPLVSRETIQRCYERAACCGAVVPVTEVVETVRQLQPDGSSRTVPRSDYRLVQTPQVFRLALLRDAYRQPYQPAFTDDASVVEARGHSVTLVPGNRENVKLTTPSDLCFAENLLRTT